MRSLRRHAAITLLLASLVVFYRRTKALRGGGGTRPPLVTWLFDRLVRLAFVLGFFYPLALLSWKAYLVTLMLYLPSYLDPAETRGGRKSLGAGLRIRQWRCWDAIKERFALQLVREEELPPGQYIFGLHPHAVMPWGAFFNVTSDINGFSELFRGLDVRVGIVSIAFWIPGYRDLALLGGVFDVSRYAVEDVLDQGEPESKNILPEPLVHYSQARATPCECRMFGDGGPWRGCRGPGRVAREARLGAATATGIRAARFAAPHPLGACL